MTGSPDDPADPEPGVPRPTPDVASDASEVIPASPRAIFAVLLDPTTYPQWLVGARRIRGIDPEWPELGSSFRHTIGWGPARVPGSTSVRRCRSPHELVLSAGMGPLGEASVRFELEPVGDGTRVQLEELPSKGVARALWRIGGSFVRVGLWGRNEVSLGALANVVRSREVE